MNNFAYSFPREVASSREPCLFACLHKRSLKVQPLQVRREIQDAEGRQLHLSRYSATKMIISIATPSSLTAFAIQQVRRLRNLEQPEHPASRRLLSPVALVNCPPAIKLTRPGRPGARVLLERSSLDAFSCALIILDFGAPP